MRYVTLVSGSSTLFREVVDGLRTLPDATVQGDGGNWRVSFTSGASLNVDDHGPADDGDTAGLHWMTEPTKLLGAHACGIALGGSADGELVADVVNLLAAALSEPAYLFDPDGRTWQVGLVDRHAVAP
ncbi:hypothetical protein [Nocardioides sp. GY 10127]|uniref:hypothetical protein n=1 Tax=Nocardioides sp. GY 10127 TaxID=2569762 RepID=UPI0010A89F81|nr:hypothetical protein [Nocardioides sp. GY 10127]TIC85411.1 hypothetical protein E8D37_01855 [Nocardioides sp. GY 10127]